MFHINNGVAIPEGHSKYLWKTTPLFLIKAFSIKEPRLNRFYNLLCTDKACCAFLSIFSFKKYTRRPTFGDHVKPETEPRKLHFQTK